MKTRSILSVWLTRLAWGLIILDLILSLIPINVIFPSTMPEQVVVLWALIIVVWIIGTLCVATTWLIFRYRAFFHTWIGWWSTFLMLFLSGAIAQGAIPATPDVISSMFSFIQICSLWSLIPVTGLRLWRQDVGLRMVGWGILAVIWGFFGALRFEGNLIADFLLALSAPSQQQPFWWLSPLLCILWWVIPAGVIGFVGHSIRLLAHEFNDNNG